MQRRDALSWLRDQGLQPDQANILVQNKQLAPEEYVEKFQDVVDVKANELDVQE